MLVLIAVVMIILFVVAALAVDFAHIHVTRSELRTATDAAARAAMENLGRTQDIDQARQAGIDAANMNFVAGKRLELELGDLQFGVQGEGPDGGPIFEPADENQNAVRVVGRRTDESPSGSVPMLFGPIFGVTKFQPVMTASAVREDRDIALVLDISGSMRNGNKFNALVAAVMVFIDELKDMPQEEQVSLTLYSTTSAQILPLSTDLDAIADELATRSPGGWTAIGLGLEDGLDSVLNDPLARPFATKEIILLTDGRHNTDISPDLVAPDCADAGVRVHTITFGNDADEALMQEVADIAGGIHVHAPSEPALIDAFRTIARHIPVMLIE